MFEPTGKEHIMGLQVTAIMLGVEDLDRSKAFTGAWAARSSRTTRAS